jgi:AcrR family transcriptional regulator
LKPLIWGRVQLGQCGTGLRIIMGISMGKGSTTREAIVNEALRQASLIGLEGVSLAPLAKSLGLSKSGLFAHFKSKESLQLNVLAIAIERFRRDVAMPRSGEDSAEKRLRGLFDRYLIWIRGTPDDGGCLFLTLAQEYDDRPGPIRDLLVASQVDWRNYLALVVHEGIEQGSFTSLIDVHQVVFDFLAAAFAYQHAAILLHDPKALNLAHAAFDRLITSILYKPRTDDDDN